jgi:hypothetical protein
MTWLQLCIDFYPFVPRNRKATKHRMLGIEDNTFYLTFKVYCIRSTQFIICLSNSFFHKRVQDGQTGKLQH